MEKRQMATDWNNVTTEAELIALFNAHQSLLKEDALITAVAALPANLALTLHGRFLAAMVFYHQQHQIPKPEDRDWPRAEGKFQALSDAQTEGALRFYVLNYLFLSRRNAGDGSTLLEALYERAKGAASYLPEQQRFQLLGFVQYNWARLLLKEGRQEEALTQMMEAGKNRIAYYDTARLADESTLRAAATEVWKIKEDWTHFFQGQWAEECPVSDTLFREVAALANKEFSAKK